MQFSPKTLAIREISNLEAVDIPLQYRPHPNNYKNKLIPDVAKHLLIGNSTAQQGRQCATNVQRKDIISQCAEQASGSALQEEEFWGH